MGTALLVARLLLALVFAVAGVAKLADREGSRRAITDFGAPSALAAPLGLLLPLAELVVAAALIPSATAWWGALGALLLLRNGVLAAIAGFVVWRGYDGTGPSVVGWVGTFPTVQLVGLVAGIIVLAILVSQWWFLLNLMRQNGRLLVRLEALEGALASGDLAPTGNGSAGRAEMGLPVGSAAPDFDLPELGGGTLSLDSLRATGKTPSCSSSPTRSAAPARRSCRR